MIPTITKTSVQPPPPVPYGTDVRTLRAWLEDVRRTVAAVVAVVNESKVPYVAHSIVGGGGAGSPPTEDPSSYNTIGDATEGNEGEETTTHTYDGTKGLYFYAMTRVAYYHAGHKKVYGYVRLVKFDKYGRLYSVGAETRVEIDATVT
jgi:hypothetical protein